MDDASVELLDALIASRVRSLSRSVPPDAEVRGGSLFPLLRRLIDSVDSERAQLLTAFPGADAASRDALGRKLLRSLHKLSTVHVLAADYVGDVRRQDVPVGVLCLIDALIADLLPDQSDPVVHLDSQLMYSTLSLSRVAADFLQDSSLLSDPGVIVFNLPALDPANVLLSPILAHEVGHTLVTHAQLLTEIFNNVDLNKLNDLFGDCLKRDQSGDPAAWKNQLNSWVRELVCDALALALTGPSFLYASAAFLPAPSPGALGSHPYAADRLRLSVEQLKALGWGDYLAAATPTILMWVESLQRATPPPATPQEEFMRGAVSLLAPAVAKVARDHVDPVLDPEDYASISPELLELMEEGIPPSKLSSGIPSPWQIVLGGWEVGLRNRGDAPPSVGELVGDRGLRDFLVKSIELARVSSLWEEL
jgi:hypothetical protein